MKRSRPSCVPSFCLRCTFSIICSDVSLQQHFSVQHDMKDIYLLKNSIYDAWAILALGGHFLINNS